MYRRLMGFFSGTMSESSEDKNKELTQAKNNVATECGQTLDDASNVTDNMAAGEQGILRDLVQKLEQDLKARIEESENYKNRLQIVEKELGVLQTIAVPPPVNKISTGVGDGIIDVNGDNTLEKEPSPNSEISNVEKLSDENGDLRTALTKASELLNDKTNLCASQEKQNLALINQVASLKEVVAITKDLLNIRNMEVQHLQSDVEAMEGKISEERQRHNTMITKMDEAVKLNSDLKKEYETQLRIFQELKNRYEEKVTLLTNENQKLEKEISLSKIVPNTTQTAQLVVTDNPVTEETDSQ